MNFDEGFSGVEGGHGRGFVEREGILDARRDLVILPGLHRRGHSHGSGKLQASVFEIERRS